MFSPYIESLFTFLQAYWLTILVGIGSALCTAFYLRRDDKMVARIKEVLHAGSIVEVETRSFGQYIRIRKKSGEATLVRPKVIQNLPPPALQAPILAEGQTLVQNDQELLYFYPENPDLGIAIPRFIDFLLQRSADAPRLRTEVVAVLATASGAWRPADIDRQSHVAYHPRHVPHRWNRKRYRKPYNGEFVMTGDLLGIIVNIADPKIVTEVRSPVTGRLSQFGAYEKTPLVPGEIVYLITTLGEPLPLSSTAIGTFYFPLVNGTPTPPPLGVTIPEGTVLGVYKALGVNSEILAPTDLQLVRCYIEHDKPIEHGSLLFHYFPKTPA